MEAATGRSHPCGLLAEMGEGCRARARWRYGPDPRRVGPSPGSGRAAPATESEQTNRAVITVALRGANRPKLVKDDGEPEDQDQQERHGDRALRLYAQEPTDLRDVAADLQRPFLQPALGVVLGRQCSQLVLDVLQDRQVFASSTGWDASSGQMASILRAV